MSDRVNEKTGAKATVLLKTLPVTEEAIAHIRSHRLRQSFKMLMLAIAVNSYAKRENNK
ncbi:MAG: hypothetical protein WBB28_21800 [Crinalium sp.]